MRFYLWDRVQAEFKQHSICFHPQGGATTRETSHKRYSYS